MGTELEQTLNRLTNALEALNEKLDRTHEENKEWLGGQVKIDAGTHTALLEAVQLFRRQFEVWFKWQTSQSTELDEANEAVAILTRSNDEMRERLKKTPAERTLDKFNETMTDATNVNEAMQMARELKQFLFHTKRGSLETDGSVLRKVTDTLEKWGYGT